MVFHDGYYEYKQIPRKTYESKNKHALRRVQDLRYRWA